MNYLYVCTQGAKVGYVEHRIIVQKEGELIRDIPIEPLECIELYGNVQMTTQAMQQCLNRNICVGVYSAGGFYIGKLNPSNETGRCELIKAQVFRSGDHHFRMEFAKKEIRAKVHNQKVVLRRHLQWGGGDTKEAIRMMDIMEKKIDDAESINEIMGYEGNVARIYFKAMGGIVPEVFRFSVRSRRPAKDPINALLNFSYAVLQNQVEGKISVRGLHPAIGLIHSTHNNKKALSYDLMEEWRPVMADAPILGALYTHEIREEHFTIGDGGEIRMTKEGMGVVRKMIEDKYECPFSYINADMKMNFRQAIKYQIDRFAGAILDHDMSKYRPCRIR